MLFKKLTEEEIVMMECWHDPVCMTECLIPQNYKAPQTWSEPDCELIKLRNYQFAMLDYSYMYADDDTLSKRENFQRKQGAGKLINVAARNIGKSFCAMIDGILTLIHGEGDESCIASFDFSHLKKICTPISNFVNHHPFFSLYRRKGKECVRYIGGGMEIDTILGHVMYGRNENVASPDPGTAFHSIHAKKHIYDESSYMTDEGRRKMIDAAHSEGCIERFCGIPDLRLGSPLGAMLRDEKNKNWICNVPQFIRSDFDKKTLERLIEEYGGVSDPQFKLNVLGEPIEGANSMFDMDRIKQNSYTTKRRIKQFEVGKETFNQFDKILVIDKQPAEINLIASDIGTTGSPSEVCIFFGDNKLLKWRYNISLFMLTTQEQAKIFKWLYDKLENCIISLDCTESSGRSIADELEILGVPQNRIVRCMFNAKMIIGFETDENGLVRYNDKGTPLYKMEQQIDFANMQLEYCLYNGLLEIPHSEKFLREFANYFCVMTGNSRRYGTTSTNHLLQSIPSDEVITCKINNSLVCDRIENIEKRTTVVDVPTYDNGKVVWQAGNIIKEKNKGNKIYEFRFRPSKALKVTEGHSMLIWDKETQDLKEVCAKDVKVGDYCLCIKNLNIEETQEYKNESLTYIVGRKKIKNQRNMIFNEELAYFLGWCCAEGFSDSSGCYHLSLGIDDPIENLEKTIFNLFGFYPRTYKYETKADMVLRGGKNIGDFIESHIGKYCYFKKVPDIILNSKSSVQEAFFNGIIDGDGNKNRLLCTTSRSIANGINIINTLNNENTTLTWRYNRCNNIEYLIGKGQKSGYFNNIPLKVLSYNYPDNPGNKKFSRLRVANSKSDKNILNKVKDFEFCEVIEITNYEYDGFIYDLSVEGTHNFCAGVGNIVVHNSMQCAVLARFQNEFGNQNLDKQDTFLGGF